MRDTYKAQKDAIARHRFNLKLDNIVAQNSKRVAINPIRKGLRMLALAGIQTKGKYNG
jgi:hypothetical protein